MRYSLAYLLLMLLLALPSHAQSDQPGPPTSISPGFQDILGGSLRAVPAGAPSVATTFTPSGDLLFIEPTVATMNLTPDQKAQFRLYATKLIAMVETVYQNNGLPKDDLGVAFGGLLQMCYELNTGTFKPGTDDPAGRKKLLTAVRQFQKALGSAPAFQALSPQDKQRDYEMGTFLIGHLLVTWQQAGQDDAKQSALRGTARQLITGLYHFDPDRLTERSTGEFTIKGNTGGANPPVASAGVPHEKRPPTPAHAAATGPLPPASLQGAQVYIKYTLTYYPSMATNYRPLFLYPDGTAFDDFPDDPGSRYDEATLRAKIPPSHAGQWKRQAETLVLDFPTQDPSRRVLRRHLDGWYDPKQTPDPKGSYGIYFPVSPVSRQTLVGEWHNDELSTLGSPGGAVPMVAAGSSGDLSLRADGTFTTGAERFASATTANEGEAFKTGGDVDVVSTNKSAGAGRWRLDGLLLTREQDGERTVHLLFPLPHWGKDDAVPDLLIDGRRWVRPSAK